MQKIPYMIVLGDNEIESGEVNVRKYGEKNSESISFDAFLNKLKEEVTNG